MNLLQSSAFLYLTNKDWRMSEPLLISHPFLMMKKISPFKDKSDWAVRNNLKQSGHFPIPLLFAEIVN